MQSKTQSLENGSISNVPLFLMMNWEREGEEEEPMEKLEPGGRTVEYTLEGNGRMPVD